MYSCLRCEAETDPELLSSIQISWKHNGDLVISGERKQVLEAGQLLRIDPIRVEDQGEVVCIVKTDADEVSSQEASLSLHKVDCVLSDWSEWSACSESCGLGHMTRHKTVIQEPQFGGTPCSPILEDTETCDAGCCVPQCHHQALLINSSQHPCGQCQCAPGWAGPGLTCGPDNDADGWSDTHLNCSETSCAQVRVRHLRIRRRGLSLDHNS